MGESRKVVQCAARRFENLKVLEAGKVGIKEETRQRVHEVCLVGAKDFSLSPWIMAAARIGRQAALTTKRLRLNNDESVNCSS